MVSPSDSITGACLGTAVGDALGMPIEGISHQNVRTYYKGIKEYRDDEQRGDLDAGQWTDDTQMTFAVVRAITAASEPAEWPELVAEQYVALRDEARRWGPTSTAAIDRLAEGTSPEASGDGERPTNGAPMRAAPLGLWWGATGADREAAWAAIRPVLAVTHTHPASLAAGFGQAEAVRAAMTTAPDVFDADAFWSDLLGTVEWAEARLAGDDEPDDRVSRRLRVLQTHLDEFPLDMRDLCDGAAGRADEAWPYACAMFARRPHLIESTLLSSINVGGDADTHGAMLGALLGALHGWEAFPDEWKEGLEDAGRLEAEAAALATALEAEKRST